MRPYRRADTDWLAGSFGIGAHWTSTSKPCRGEALPYQEAVAAFDLGHFVRQLREAGARHLIFTLTHAQHYLPCPNPVLDYLLPGRTAKRDLVGELADALEAAGIRLICYYNHSCNCHNDPAWEDASGYACAPLDLFSGRILGVVESLSRRYGKKISGWWFDSCYSVDPKGPHNSVSTVLGDWQFPWEALSAAAKSGNPDTLVTFNAGVGEDYLYTRHQDYCAGENTCLAPAFPYGRYNQAGLQCHQWLCLDNPAWTHHRPDTPFAPLLYTDDELAAYCLDHFSQRGALTFNVEIDQAGTFNPDAIAQLRSVCPAS